MIISLLEQEYGEPVCQLYFTFDYELMIAARLSAQCTDKRVNTVTPLLFKKYPTLRAFATANVLDVEKIIFSCGFYRTKAEDIVSGARMLIDKFSGRVPDTMDELLCIPGVGRKTANLLLGEIYKQPSIVVDTHCIRLSNRIGLVDTKNPEKIETQLREMIPPVKSIDFCRRLILHGRAVCSARSPKCNSCCIIDYCRFGKSLVY